MAERDTQLRKWIESVIRERAADFNGTLHYDAAVQLVSLKYGYADITLVLSVLNKLEKEGVVWR